MGKLNSKLNALAACCRKFSEISFLTILVAVLLPVFWYLFINCSVPIWLYWLVLISLRTFYIVFGEAFVFYKKVKAGQLAECEINELLANLADEWRIEKGIYIEGIGDVDFLVTSPDQRSFIVEVKSHKGIVTTNGKTLLRLNKFGARERLFEKDFLLQVMRQALTVKNRRQLDFVTPIIVFTQAQLHLMKNKLRGVYVLEKNDLLKFLCEHNPKIMDESKDKHKMKILKL